MSTEAKGLREPLRNLFEYNSGPCTVEELCEQMSAAVILGKEVLSAMTFLPQGAIILTGTLGHPVLSGISPQGLLACGYNCPHIVTQRADQAGGTLPKRRVCGQPWLDAEAP